MKTWSKFIFINNGSLLVLFLSSFLLASGCALFGGGSDESTDDILEDAGDDTEGAYDQGFDQEFDQESYNDDAAGDLDSYSEDTEDVADSYSEDVTMGADAGAATGATGNVFFVQSSADVVSSMQGGQILYTLQQGDTVAGEASGEYTMIGVGQYVLTASLTSGAVARMVEANPWR